MKIFLCIIALLGLGVCSTAQSPLLPNGLTVDPNLPNVSVTSNLETALYNVVSYLQSSTTGSDTLTVPAMYTTVQAAVNAAVAAGASASNPYVISVAPGTHSEQVTLQDGVYLVGVDKHTSVISHYQNGGTILPNGNCGIRNLTVLNKKSAAPVVDACDVTTGWSTVANVTTSVDTAVSTICTGGKSVKFVIASGFTTGSVGVLTTSAFATYGASNQRDVFIAFRTSATVAANVYQIKLATGADGSGTAVTSNLPAMLANTWYYLPLTFTAQAGIQSVSIVALSDPGAVSIYIDDICRSDPAWTLIATASQSQPFRVTSTTVLGAFSVENCIITGQDDLYYNASAPAGCSLVVKDCDCYTYGDGWTGVPNATLTNTNTTYLVDHKVSQYGNVFCPGAGASTVDHCVFSMVIPVGCPTTVAQMNILANYRADATTVVTMRNSVLEAQVLETKCALNPTPVQMCDGIYYLDNVQMLCATAGTGSAYHLDDGSTYTGSCFGTNCSANTTLSANINGGPTIKLEYCKRDAGTRALVSTP
jgi:hypothetical protein